jgi:hypothetical protein
MQNEQGFVSAGGEPVDLVVVLAQDVVDLDRRDAFKPDPDRLGWWTVQKRELAEVGVRRNGDEVVLPT